MTREIAYLLLATAAACALLLVLLLAWHEFSGRARSRRYRTQVSAARLGIRQERTAQARSGRRAETTVGTYTVHLELDTTKFDEQMAKVQEQVSQSKWLNELGRG